MKTNTNKEENINQINSLKDTVEIHQAIKGLQNEP